MNFRITILSIVALCGCALPAKSIKTGSTRPSVYVRSAPRNSILVVDHLEMGDASQLNGDPKVLAIEEGRHLIQIKSESTVIYEEPIFISAGESKEIVMGTKTK